MSESFNASVFDKITTTPHTVQDSSNKQNFWYFFKLSRESEESKKLGNFIIILSGMFLYSVFYGFAIKDFDIISVGSYQILHIGAYLFSLYALLKAKHTKDNLFTYGYSRYETLAAFSNCVFLIITGLFLVLGSLHFHSEEEEENQQQEGEDNNNNHDHHHESKIIYLYYALLVYNIAGAFSFADYALFVPLQDISKNFNISGVSQDDYDAFSRIYNRFHQFINEHMPGHRQHHHDHIAEDEEDCQILAHQGERGSHNNNIHQVYSSHYENMHSIFLHFLIELIFNLGKIFAHHLQFIPFIDLIETLIVFVLAIMICKRLLVVSSRLLLQALPIEDNKNVTEFLSMVNRVEGVIDIKEKYFWGLTTGFLVCNLKLVISKNSNYSKISQEINQLVSNKFQDICIQMEREL